MVEASGIRAARMQEAENLTEILSADLDRIVSPAEPPDSLAANIRRFKLDAYKRGLMPYAILAILRDFSAEPEDRSLFPRLEQATTRGRDRLNSRF